MQTKTMEIAYSSVSETNKQIEVKLKNICVLCKNKHKQGEDVTSLSS